MIVDGLYVSAEDAARLAAPIGSLLRSWSRTNGVPLSEPARSFLRDLESVALAHRVRPEHDGTPRNAADDDDAHDAAVTCSTKEAAGLLGIGERAVRYLCERGTLEATRSGRCWKIDGTSLACLVAERKY